MNFSKSTEVNKRIPKQKFYENITITPTLKRIFVEQIKTIYWRNKIAATTVNLAPGKIVTEVEVFEMKLEKVPLDEAVLRQIDREIPYHIIFLLEYEGKYQAWTSYKEASSGNTAFKVGTYYHTEWLPEEDLPIHIDGLDMDAVWENIIVQIGSVKIEQGKTLDEQIAKDERKARTLKEIERLEKLARAEKQPKKKYELVQKINELKNQRDD